MGFHPSDHGLETMRVQHVIAVEEFEVPAPRQLRAAVMRRELAKVGVVADRAHPLAVDIPGDDPRRAVRRTVVDDDEIPVGKRLGDHTVDRRADVALVVTDGNDDGDKRGHGTTGPQDYRTTGPQGLLLL